LDSRGGGTQWRMAAKKWTLPQYCEGRTSAWHLRATVWPDRALEETTKLAEAGVVGGGRRRCRADVFVRWWSFWLPEARATLLLLDEMTGWLGLQKCSIRSSGRCAADGWLAAAIRVSI